MVIEARPRLGVGGAIRTDYFVNFSKYFEKVFDTGTSRMGSIDLPSIRFFRTAGTTVTENGGGILLGPVPHRLATPATAGKEPGADGKQAGNQGESGSAREPPPGTGPEICMLMKIFETGK